jgi:hypothetical protein
LRKIDPLGREYILTVCFYFQTPEAVCTFHNIVCLMTSTSIIIRLWTTVSEDFSHEDIVDARPPIHLSKSLTRYFMALFGGQDKRRPKLRLRCENLSEKDKSDKFARLDF